MKSPERLAAAVPRGQSSFLGKGFGSELEREAFLQMIANKIREPVTQYAFDPNHPRRRSDFAWPRLRLLLEIDGGTHGVRNARPCPRCKRSQSGGHNTAKGYERDRMRDAEAMILGWTVLRVTGDMVRDGRMVDILKRLMPALKGRHGV